MNGIGRGWPGNRRLILLLLLVMALMPAAIAAIDQPATGVSAGAVRSAGAQNELVFEEWTNDRIEPNHFINEVRDLNEKMIESSKSATLAALDAFEKALHGVGDLEQKAAAATQLDWISAAATSHAKFMADAGWLRAIKVHSNTKADFRPGREPTGGAARPGSIPKRSPRAQT